MDIELMEFLLDVSKIKNIKGKKMKKKVLSILFFGIVAINFSGCFLDEISCNDETAQELVQEIVTKDVLNTIFAIKFNKKSGAVGFDTNGDLLNRFDDSILFAASFKNFRDNTHIDKFTLSSFITKNKNKELKKVECKSSINVIVGVDEYNFDVEYEAQLTDDGKEVYVEVDSLYNRAN